MNLAAHNRMLLKIEKEKRKEKESWRDIKGNFLDAKVKIVLVSHAVIFTSVLTITKALHHQLASIFATNILWFQRISQRTSAFEWSARTNLTASSMRCFLLTNWNPLSMYNLTQFVLKFLIGFLLVFSLYVFIVYLHLLKFF